MEHAVEEPDESVRINGLANEQVSSRQLSLFGSNAPRHDQNADILVIRPHSSCQLEAVDAVPGHLHVGDHGLNVGSRLQNLQGIARACCSKVLC